MRRLDLRHRPAAAIDAAGDLKQHDARSESLNVNEAPPDSAIMPPRSKAARIDGRHLRSERTRQLIVEAYMALVRESPQVPTAAQIADRAGYSVRSVFERFPDLHALRVAVTDHAIAQGTALNPLSDVNADRLTRIKSQVEARARGCERWLALWRVLNASRNDSAELQKRIDLVRSLVMKRIEVLFGKELETISELDRKKTIYAIEALTDFESWARMRETFGLTREQACNVWIRAIDRLLPATPAAT